MPGGINQVTLSGNLTRDPELRSLPSGMAVCEVGLAVNERVKQGEEWVDRVNYFDVTVWGAQGENLARFLRKGSYLVVAGRLRWESWTDQQSGQKRSKVKVVASPGGTDWGPRVDGQGAAPQQQQQQQSYYGQPPQQQAPPPDVPNDFQPRPQQQQAPPLLSVPSGAGADDDIPF